MGRYFLPEAADFNASTGQIIFPDANLNLIGSSNLFWDNTNYRLGIGTVSPRIAFDVTNGIANTAGDAPGTTDITGPSQIPTVGTLSIESNDNMAAGIGSSLVFKARYQTGTNAGSMFATIRGLKENGVSGNLSGLLLFHVRTDGQDGNTASEKMRIVGSTGNVGIGTSTPAQTLDVAGFINTLGQKRVSTQFDKTTDTTLANIPGLSVNVAAAGTYKFEAVLFIAASAVGGSKYAIAGTATATFIIYHILLIDNTTNANTITAEETSLGAAVGQAGTTSGLCIIRGTITVNGAGTLTVQFAQNASNTTSSVLVGSTFIVDNIA